MSASVASATGGTGDGRARLRRELRELEAANARAPSLTLERALIDRRIAGFDEIRWPEPAATPPATPAPVDDGELVEIHARDLTADTLRSAVEGGGGLIVREFMAAGRVAEMRDLIDRALAARREAAASEAPSQSRWFARSALVKGGPQQFWAASAAQRQADVGSMWAVDSPAAAQAMATFYVDAGLADMLEACFGEAAVLSVRKWVLRKVMPKTEGGSGWHQDGRFLGDGIRTINLWLSLSDCGGARAAPGLEIVADHRKNIHETGTRGAMFDWVVGPELVAELARERPVLTPEFGPGDALFFDQYNLHRTQCSPTQTELRYAVESWFFAASRAPRKQGPLLLRA